MTVADPFASVIVAMGAAMFGWLVYGQRIAIVEWLAVEILSLRDALLARRTARAHWRERLKEEARIEKVVEWRAR